MVYDKSRRRTGLDTANIAADFADNVAKLVKAIGCRVFGGR